MATSPIPTSIGTVPSNGNNLDNTICDGGHATNNGSSSLNGSLKTGPNQNKSEDDEQGIKFKDWGFRVDRLFEVAYRFYKRNEGKVFHLSFDIRNQMNALILQARYGNFSNSKAPDLGMLDLVGKNRQYQWSLLSGMSKTEAMAKFICTLDELCPFFKAHAEAVKISSETKSQNSDRLGSIHLMGDDLSRPINLESEEQLKSIHTALCRQTFNQFKSFAEKQHPNDVPKQKHLVSTLQEQYYQQYISQMHPELDGVAQKNRVIDVCDNESTRIMVPDSPSANGQPPEEGKKTFEKSEGRPFYMDELNIQADILNTSDRSSSTTGLEPYTSNETGKFPHESISQPILMKQSPPNDQQITITPPASRLDQNQVDSSDWNRSPNQTDPAVSDLPRSSQAHVKESWSSSGSSGHGSPLQQSFSYAPLEPATIWSKKGVEEFRDSLENDKHGGSYVVTQGSTLIIQVPTYPGGKFIHWEFTTDGYDIAFGLDFIYDSNLIEPLSLKIFEETDDDEYDDDDLNMPQAGTPNNVEAGHSDSISRQEFLRHKEVMNFEREANTINILPTYRRNSHEEIFIGRHRYPGRGYYQLKFDNTYSVLRPKTLFFRICYFV